MMDAAKTSPARVVLAYGMDPEDAFGRRLESSAITDATKVSNVLEAAGCAVLKLRALCTREAIVEDISRASQQVPSGSIIVMYFAGHGVIFNDCGRGTSICCRDGALGVHEIEAQWCFAAEDNGLKGATLILIVDCCLYREASRDTGVCFAVRGVKHECEPTLPLNTALMGPTDVADWISGDCQMFTMMSSSLGALRSHQIPPHSVSQLAFATGHPRVATSPGNTSRVFTAALLDFILRPDPVDVVMKNVTRAVSQATEGMQRPSCSSTLSHPLVLIPDPPSPCSHGAHKSPMGREAMETGEALAMLAQTAMWKSYLPVGTSDRHALVFGSGALGTFAASASAFATALSTQCGFSDVKVFKDELVLREQMLSQAKLLGRSVRANGLVLIYFSGYGEAVAGDDAGQKVLDSRGTPVSVRELRVALVSSIPDVEGVKVVILLDSGATFTRRTSLCVRCVRTTCGRDACRNAAATAEPATLAANDVVAQDKTMAKCQTFVGMACTPGGFCAVLPFATWFMVACGGAMAGGGCYAGPAGSNFTFFTAALLRGLDHQPPLNLHELMGAVRTTVYQDSNYAQTPQWSSDVDSDIVLALAKPPGQPPVEDTVMHADGMAATDAAATSNPFFVDRNARPAAAAPHCASVRQTASGPTLRGPVEGQ